MIGRILIGCALLWTLSACSRDGANGPGEVRWDQETCQHCLMAISDHRFAAQVRGGQPGEQTRLYKFDDIGCATIWLETQGWKNDPETGIWVADHLSGKWIDAHSAWYVTGMHSPMGYGLAAQALPAEGALDYQQAKDHIRRIEAHDHIQDRHLQGLHEGGM